jgi:transporter family-2 protein
MDRVSWVYLGLAVVTGMLLPLQPAINKQLRDHVGSPWLAALVSFTVGTLLLMLAVLVLVVMRDGLPAAAEVRAAPWWAWVGGAIGAVFVTASIVLVPQLGVVLLVGAVLFGQLLSSVIIDHFGLVGMRQQQVNWGRVAGVLLLLAGVVLIQRSTPRQPSEVAPVGDDAALVTEAEREPALRGEQPVEHDGEQVRS